MSSPASRSKARRQQRWRQRQKTDTAVVNIELKPYCRVIDALIVSGALTPDDALDRHEVARAVGDIVTAWAATWATK